MAVMLSPSVELRINSAKHLAFLVTYKHEILRLSPQDDIASQSPYGDNGGGLNDLNVLTLVSEVIP
jgi:hypothetical protein